MSAEQQDQALLFETDPEWKDHWKGMPEFVQQDLQPIKQITVNFESEDDLKAFGELVGQTVTMSTRSIWFPEAEIGHYANKRYTAEAEK